MGLKNISAMTFVTAIMSFAAPAAWAQDTQNEIDCEQQENQDDEACLALPAGGGEITNFVPLIGAAAGAAALAGFAGSGGSTVNTTSTTSTTGGSGG
jgi:hypothetical protein